MQVGGGLFLYKQVVQIIVYITSSLLLFNYYLLFEKEEASTFNYFFLSTFICTW
jgi:hypothetical protein